MADGSRGSMEGVRKIAEQVAEPVAEQQAGEVIQLQPEPSEEKPEGQSTEVKKKLREQDITIARRESLRLQLGGAPTPRQLSSEKLRLSARIGDLRAERATLIKQLLKADAEQSEERSLRLKEIESEIGLTEVRRTDILYWESMAALGEPSAGTNPEALPEREVDALRRERSTLQEQLDRTSAGIFAFFKRRSLESRLKEIDRRTRILVDSQRDREEMAAK